MRRTLPLLALLLAVPARAADALPGSKPLTEEGDLAAKMIEGVGKYLDRETAAAVVKRKEYWKLDVSSAEAYAKSVQPQSGPPQENPRRRG